MIQKELSEVIACPKCKGGIIEKEMFLVCEKCKLAYPVLEDGTPDMLPEDVWELEKAEQSNFKHNFKKY